ncbi:Zona pellucida domain-containing protein [Strongyloides ratti]|uniref:Zona pellucida domain-containing protein n=1 Tax=Strongyloides ratti TaxID=34506 RepID=A0A090MRX5_STRRB|nr:Zona pellucida domain-containing protein [Strongyloides ratti]CEF61003.1 Zona pellucida domain-containing protein [Strongyloides ratti]
MIHLKKKNLRLDVISVIGEFMDNELIGDPEVNCEDTMMSINFKTKKPFNGRVYVKGMANDDRCSRNFAQNTEQNKFSFMIQSGDCTMQKQRVTGTLEGMMVSLTVVVSFHGTFVTKADRAFKAMCFFKNIRRITNAIDMNNLGTTELLDTAKMPTCTYHIRKSLDGPMVATGEVGDKIYHVWECDDPTHGFLVHSCYVDDGRGQRFDLLDIDGCAIDPIIQPDVVYDEAHNRAVAETFGYKFADTSVLNYQCVVELCKRASGECEGLTPPDCTKRVKRNSPISLINDNNTIELDLSATISVDDDTLIIEGSDKTTSLNEIKKSKKITKIFENGECNAVIFISISATLLFGIIVNTATIVYFCSLKKIIPILKP